MLNIKPIHRGRILIYLQGSGKIFSSQGNQGKMVFQPKSGKKFQIREIFQQWVDRQKVVEMYMPFGVAMWRCFTFGKCICNKLVLL